MTNSPQRPKRPNDPRPPMPDGAVEPDDFVDAESMLAALRKGHNQKLEIGFGDFKIPVKLMSAAEELKIVINATQRVEKSMAAAIGVKLEVSISYAVMTDILYEACRVGKSFLPTGFLEKLTSKELAALYDQYTDLNAMVNPNVQELSTEEILQIVDGIKKKTVITNNLFSYQLRAIGKYFLDVIIPSLQMASERGSL